MEIPGHTSLFFSRSSMLSLIIMLKAKHSITLNHVNLPKKPQCPYIDHQMNILPDKCNLVSQFILKDKIVLLH